MKANVFMPNLNAVSPGYSFIGCPNSAQLYFYEIFRIRSFSTGDG